MRGFEVVGNTLLPQAEIDQALAAYLGPATLARLREAAAAVQDLYRRAGYGGVVAFLPEQEASDGLLRIRVVEGRLTRVDISGQQQFSAANIRASLPALREGSTPEVRRIDAQIQMANESPAKTVQVLLRPGAEPGEVAAQISVAEQPLQQWTLRADNTGSGHTGRLRAAIGWQHGNLFGDDQVASLDLQTSPAYPSSVAVLSGAYRAPLYARALAVDAYGAWSDVDGGKTGTAAGDLQFSGRGSVLGARLSAYLPRQGNIDQRLAVGLELRDYRNACSIAGLPEDACGSAGASVRLLPLSLGYTAQAAGDIAWNGSATLQANLGSGGRQGGAAAFEAVRPGSRVHYAVLRLNGIVTLRPIETAVLQLRASAQYSDTPLVPGEQFGIGGSLSVRGYEERELNGDWGTQFSLELSSANVAESWFGLARTELRGLLFADAGWTGYGDGSACLAGRSACRIGGLGAGLRLAMRQAQFRLDLAQAMAGGQRTQRGAHRLHASFSASF
ncbi:MAG: ShlB/FhaC/HecB family hemolysin secretion/activation protein [Burkholderiaceae bacterium]|nr:ShlB/FhaC/HecB family hemolysin secretion/activation protein [Burkholderiaceae bacterium]